MQVQINGRVVSGTANQIAEILAEIERKTEGGTYFSDSKNEDLYIADMDTVHIMNAVRKMIRNWEKGLHFTIDPETFAEEVEAGVPSETFQNLLAELRNR